MSESERVSKCERASEWLSNAMSGTKAIFMARTNYDTINSFIHKKLSQKSGRNR